MVTQQVGHTLVTAYEITRLRLCTTSGVFESPGAIADNSWQRKNLATVKCLSRNEM
jgi:hypothetical protein